MKPPLPQKSQTSSPNPVLQLAKPAFLQSAFGRQTRSDRILESELMGEGHDIWNFHSRPGPNADTRPGPHIAFMRSAPFVDAKALDKNAWRARVEPKRPEDNEIRYWAAMTSKQRVEHLQNPAERARLRGALHAVDIQNRIYEQRHGARLYPKRGAFFPS